MNFLKVFEWSMKFYKKKKQKIHVEGKNKLQKRANKWEIKMNNKEKKKYKISLKHQQGWCKV